MDIWKFILAFLPIVVIVLVLVFWGNWDEFVKFLSKATECIVWILLAAAMITIGVGLLALVVKIFHG